MSLMCYEPWALLNQLQGEVGGVSDRRTARRSQYQHLAAASDGVPALDIREADARYLIHADLPGVEPAVIEVSMEDGVLSIKVERGTEHEEQRRSCRIACMPVRSAPGSGAECLTLSFPSNRSRGQSASGLRLDPGSRYAMPACGINRV